MLFLLGDILLSYKGTKGIVGADRNKEISADRWGSVHHDMGGLQGMGGTGFTL